MARPIIICSLGVLWLGISASGCEGDAATGNTRGAGGSAGQLSTGVAGLGEAAATPDNDLEPAGPSSAGAGPVPVGTAGAGAVAATVVAGAPAVFPGDPSKCGPVDGAVADLPTGDLFASAEVPVFDFYMPEADWNHLIATATQELFQPATLCYAGKTVGTVGLRFKGSYGTLLNCFDTAGKQTCDKLSMKVKFDEYDDKLEFFGLHRLVFNSMIWDPSHLHERLVYDLYRSMGIVAPRAAWARLRVNGKEQGLFGMIEPVDGKFVDDRWPLAKNGNLFKEAWPHKQDPVYLTSQLATNESAADISGFVAFSNAIDAATTPVEARAALGTFTDLDYLARYMAVDDAVANVDGITAVYVEDDLSWSGNHNFYFYQEPTRNYYWLIPWDMDSTLNPSVGYGAVPRWDQVPADCSQRYPVWQGQNFVLAPGCLPVFMALASDLTAYRAAVDQLLVGPFAEDTLYAQIDQHAAQIADAVALDPVGPSVDTWRSEIARLKAAVPILRAQLSRFASGQPVTPLAVNAKGITDFETLDEVGLHIGPILMSNSTSSTQTNVNSTSPINGTKSLRLEFEYHNESDPWQQWLYYSLPLSATVDATRLTGVRLRVRTDQSRTLRLDVESPAQTATDAGVRFGWDVAVTNTATLIEKRFADAAVQSWAVDQGKDPHDDKSKVLQTLTGIALHPLCNGRGNSGQLPGNGADKGWMEIDDIELY